MAIDFAWHCANNKRMNLRDYIKAEHGRAAKLAKAMKIPPCLITQWSTVRQVPAERCPAIEKATAGAVRCEDLRPDVDWTYLRGTACACEHKEVA